MDFLYTSLGGFNYGSAHASKQQPHFTYICQQKMGESYGIVESSYKQLNSCFMAFVSFYKVYKTSKGLSFSLKRLYCVFKKRVWFLIINGAKCSRIT